MWRCPCVDDPQVIDPLQGLTSLITTKAPTLLPLFYEYTFYFPFRSQHQHRFQPTVNGVLYAPVLVLNATPTL